MLFVVRSRWGAARANAIWRLSWRGELRAVVLCDPWPATLPGGRTTARRPPPFQTLQASRRNGCMYTRMSNGTSVVPCDTLYLKTYLIIESWCFRERNCWNFVNLRTQWIWEWEKNKDWDKKQLSEWFVVSKAYL